MNEKSAIDPDRDRNPDRDRLKRVFAEALPLEGVKREEYLQLSCRGDVRLRNEVESLLEHHRGDTVLARLEDRKRNLDAAPHVDKSGTSDSTAEERRHNRVILLAGVCAAAIVALAVALNVAIRGATRDQIESQLTASATAVDAALTLLLDSLEEHAAIAAADPDLIAVLATDGGAETAAASRTERLRDLLTATMRRGHIGAGLIDERGVVIATSRGDFEDRTGRRLNGDGMAMLGKARERRKPVLRMPYAAGLHFEGGAPPSEHAVRPVFAIVAPVFDAAGTFLAALALVVDPNVQLTPLLVAQRLGQSGESYAFDSRGTMLSGSRFDDELRRIGILPDDPELGSALRIRLTDPGEDLTSSSGHEAVSTDRPLTRMAASATSGHSGIDLDGYRDYRGREVVGAWRWIPDRDFGFAVEIDAAEAFRPSRLLVAGSIGLLTLLALSFFLIVRSFSVESKLVRDLEKAQRYGRYQLVRKLGEGGMGEVWLARHAMLTRPVALKLIRREHASEEGLAQFNREVELTSRLTHPNVIAIYDYGVATTGEPYYVMEYVDGIDTKQLVKKGGPFPAARAVHVIREVCSALIEAHEAGLVHRDIKASNVMLCRRGGRDDEVELLDFGLVIERTSVPSDSTRIGFVSGTPPYVPPERWRNPQARDPRSDLYSVGVLAFYLLTARLPFGDEGGDELVKRVMNEPAPKPSLFAPEPLPADLDRLVLDLLEKRPDARPATAREVVDRIAGLRDLSPWTPA